MGRDVRAQRGLGRSSLKDNNKRTSAMRGKVDATVSTSTEVPDAWVRVVSIFLDTLQ